MGWVRMTEIVTREGALERRMSLLEQRILALEQTRNAITLAIEITNTLSQNLIMWFDTHALLHSYYFWYETQHRYTQPAIRQAAHKLAVKGILIRVAPGVYELNKHYNPSRAKPKSRQVS